MNRLQRILFLVRSSFARLASKPHPSGASGQLVILLVLAAIVVNFHAWTAVARSEARIERDAMFKDAQRLEQEIAAHKNRRSFLEQLPKLRDDAQNPTPITTAIQHKALAHDVSLVSLNSTYEAPTAKLLGHTAWAVSLQGTYPNIKTVLAELLDATPNLRILKLKLHRLSTQDIEAQVMLVRWFSPNGA